MSGRTRRQVTVDSSRARCWRSHWSRGGIASSVRLLRGGHSRARRGCGSRSGLDVLLENVVPLHEGEVLDELAVVRSLDRHHLLQLTHLVQRGSLAHERRSLSDDRRQDRWKFVQQSLVDGLLGQENNGAAVDDAPYARNLDTVLHD